MANVPSLFLVATTDQNLLMDIMEQDDGNFTIPDVFDLADFDRENLVFIDSRNTKGFLGLDIDVGFRSGGLSTDNSTMMVSLDFITDGFDIETSILRSAIWKAYLDDAFQPTQQRRGLPVLYMAYGITNKVADLVGPLAIQFTHSELRITEEALKAIRLNFVPLPSLLTSETEARFMVLNSKSSDLRVKGNIVCEGTMTIDPANLSDVKPSFVTRGEGGGNAAVEFVSEDNIRARRADGTVLTRDHRIVRPAQETVTFGNRLERSFGAIDYHVVIKECLRGYLKQAFSTDNVIVAFPDLNHKLRSTIIRKIDQIKQAYKDLTRWDPSNDPFKLNNALPGSLVQKGLLSVFKDLGFDIRFKMPGVSQEEVAFLSKNIVPYIDQSIERDLSIGQVEVAIRASTVKSKFLNPDYQLPNLNDPLLEFTDGLIGSSEAYAFQMLLIEESDVRMLKEWQRLNLIKDLKPTVVFGDASFINQYLYRRRDLRAEEPEGAFSLNQFLSDTNFAENTDLEAEAKRLEGDPNELTGDVFEDLRRSAQRFTDSANNRTFININQTKERLKRYNESPVFFHSSDSYLQDADYHRTVGQITGIQKVGSSFGEIPIDLQGTKLPVFAYNIKNSNVLDIKGDFKSGLYGAVIPSVFSRLTPLVEINYSERNKEKLTEGEISSESAITQIIEEGFTVEERRRLLITLVETGLVGAGALKMDEEDLSKTLAIIFTELQRVAPQTTMKYFSLVPELAFSEILNYLYDKAYTVQMRTLPFLHLSYVHNIGQECILVARENEIIQTRDIVSRRNLQTNSAFFSGLYKLVGFRHVIRVDDIFSEFVLVKDVVPGREEKIE
jgi:hypothetical protein